MSFGFLSVRRRTLLALVLGTALGMVADDASADQFNLFLNNAHSFQVAPDTAVLPEPTGMSPEPTGMSTDEFEMVEASEDQAPEKAEDVDDEADADDDDDSDDDSLAELSKRLDEFDEQLEDYEDSLGKVEKLAGNKSIVVSGSSKSTMKISGRVHVDAWGFDDDNDPAITQFNGGVDPRNRLGFRRLRFGVKGKIQDNMVYKIEAEFANGNDMEFRDAYLGWSDLPFLQKVLLGNQKRPFGLDHLNSSRFNVFLERPFVIEAFNEDARRLGLQSYGISEDQKWNWRYGVFNQRNIQDEGNYVADHLQLQLAARLAKTAWYDETSGGRGYAHWAISGAHADVSNNLTSANGDAESEAQFRTRPEARTGGFRQLDTGTIAGADYYNLIGLETVLNLGAFQFVGEYQSNWVERNGAEDVNLDGGYFYISYFLTGEHMPWDRTSGTLGRAVPFQNFWLVNKSDGTRDAGWGAFQLAARYSYADFSDEDIFGGEGESFTFAMNWLWNPNARVQFNYINGQISNSDVGARGTTPTSGNYNVYGARFMVDF